MNPSTSRSTRGRGGSHNKKRRNDGEGTPSNSSASVAASPLPPRYSFSAASDCPPPPPLRQQTLPFSPPPTLNPNPSPQTLNPQEQTLHPTQQTLNPQSQTLNPQPQTLNPQPPTLNPSQIPSPSETTHSANPRPSASNFSLEDLLALRSRDEYFPRLSPNEGDGLWFDRDESVLVRRISKILKEKFDGPYCSWSVTPTEKQDAYFVQLAHHYTWDPLITPLVRQEFDSIAQRRLKGLVSHARCKNKRPKWIGNSLWQELEAKWATEEAKDRSTNASQNRNSDREGLGVSKHVAGPRSFAQISRDMEVEYGRPVGIGEVFIKTHTRKDGSFVDAKAKLIAEAYDKNLQSKLDQLGTDPSLVSDGTSKLTTTEMDKIFLASTMPDERGNQYGLGRLALTHGSGRDSFSSSSTIATLQEQLQAAQRKIEEQELENRRRDEEFARRDAESQRTKNDMDLILGYLQKKDPDFLQLLASRSSADSTSCDGNASNDPAS